MCLGSNSKVEMCLPAKFSVEYIGDVNSPAEFSGQPAFVYRAKDVRSRELNFYAKFRGELQSSRDVNFSATI